MTFQFLPRRRKNEPSYLDAPLFLILYFLNLLLDFPALPLNVLRFLLDVVAQIPLLYRFGAEFGGSFLDPGFQRHPGNRAIIRERHGAGGIWNSVGVLKETGF